MTLPSTSTTLTENICFAYDNKLWAASLSCPTGNALIYPLSNLKLQSPSEYTRIVGTSATIHADLGAAFSIQAAILYFTNLTPTATIEVRSADDNSFTVNNVSRGTLTVGDHGFRQSCLPIFLANPVTARYWRWIITDSSNATGTLDLGVGFIGPILQFSKQFSVGIHKGVVDLSDQIRGNYNGIYIDRRTRYRRISFTIFGLDRDEAFITWPRFAEYVGKSIPLFVGAWPKDANINYIREWTRYGVFNSIGENTQPQNGLWTTDQVVFEEWAE